VGARNCVRLALPIIPQLGTGAEGLKHLDQPQDIRVEFLQPPPVFFSDAPGRSSSRPRPATGESETRLRLPSRPPGVATSMWQVDAPVLAEIDWIEAARYYACLHLADDTHIVRRTIQQLDQDLDPRTFFRIHRSIIVDLERVRGLELQESGEYEVVLDSKIRLKLSRRFRKRFQDRLAELSSGR
jgi:hypothetical protein